ncbi:CBS domain-containing protein, partial [Streptomyces botrytidirepellens]
MSQRIREIMTSPPVTVQPQTPVADVARRMREENIGDILITEGDQLRGLITDRDLVVRVLAEGGDPGAKPVQEVCSEDVVAVSPDDDTDRAVQLMRERAMRRLPVVE